MELGGPIYKVLVGINTKKGTETRKVINMAGIMRSAIAEGKLKKPELIDDNTINIMKERYTLLGFETLLALWCNAYFQLDMFKELLGKKHTATFTMMCTMVAIAECIVENQKEKS